MFNLLVSGSAWADQRDTIPVGRAFEYTEKHLVERFMPGGLMDVDAVISHPALFLEESFGGGDPVGRVGRITRVRQVGRDLSLEYVFDHGVPPLRNSRLQAFADDLEIEDFEFHRTHWSIKDVDLFQILLRNLEPRRQRPKVFQIADPENIEPTLISAMMPFHPDFNEVYASISDAAEATGFHCRRADNIWENPAVIQDVVSLIDRSKIVVCDCSGRNPNVFYEIGIAHTLGREVVLITQSGADIPFDLRHLRYVEYLNNGEGRNLLSARLRQRFGDLI